MRRDTSAFLFAILSPFVLAACNPIVVGGGGGGGAGGGGETCTTTPTDPNETCTIVIGAAGGGGGMTQTGTWTFTGTDGECGQYGGTCAQYIPDLGCPNGVWDDWNKHACSGDDANCCFPIVCAPGADQTCNHYESMSSFAGHCEESGICTCLPGHKKGEDGKCQ